MSLLGKFVNAAGQALLTGIDVVTAVDGATAGVTSKQKLDREKNPQQSIEYKG